MESLGFTGDGMSHGNRSRGKLFVSQAPARALCFLKGCRMNSPFLYIALGNGYGPLPAKTIEEALSSGFRDDRVYAVEVFDKSTGKCVANVRRADYSKGDRSCHNYFFS